MATTTSNPPRVRGAGAPPTGTPRTGTPRTGRHVPWLAVVLPSVAVAVYFPGQYLVSGLQGAARSGTGLAATYANDPWFIRVAFYLHIVFAGVALLTGPFQFSRRLRARALGLHRWVGRTYVAAVGLGGLAAFVMSFVSSVALLGFFGFGTLAVLWVWTTFRGYRAVRSGEIRSHQAWMIRSFALTYAAVTLRLWLIVFLVGLHLFAGDVLTDQQISAYAYAPVPFLCWLPNIVVAELLVRRRGLPGLRFVTEAELRRPAGAPA